MNKLQKKHLHLLEEKTEEQTLSAAEEIRVDINSLFDSGVHQDIVVNSAGCNTPTQLGTSCDRRLVFAQTRGTEAQRHSTALQKIYDYGKLIGEYVQTRLKRDGFAVLQNQRPFKDNILNLSGRIDCMIKHNSLGSSPILCEIKSISPFYFDKYNSQEDFLNSSKYYYRNYYMQIQSYLYLIGLEREEWGQQGILILFDKNSASLKGVMFKRNDDYIVDGIINRCQKINYYVKHGMLPDAEYSEELCPECPFSHICDTAKPVADTYVIDELELIEAIEEREGLKKHYKKYGELDDFIKETFKSYKRKTGQNQFL